VNLETFAAPVSDAGGVFSLEINYTTDERIERVVMQTGDGSFGIERDK
jgi:hypothetical protein